MSGHPGGPGGSGTPLVQTRRPTRYNANPTKVTSRMWAPMIPGRWNCDEEKPRRMNAVVMEFVHGV